MPTVFTPTRHAPAPWLLEGRAFGILGVLRKRPDAPAWPRLLVLCAVEYSDSPVGSYNEIFSLVAPASGGLTRGEVTHMYVDSEESTYWGRRNWAVPKVTSEIDLQWSARRISAELMVAGAPACRMELSPRGRFRALPAILPRGVAKISQATREHRLLTGLAGSGRVSLCRIHRVETFQDAMPARSLFFPIAGFLVHRFAFSMETPSTIPKL